MSDLTGDQLPAVSTVIATRDRPELLAEAVSSVLGQRYAGDVEVIVVFDQAPARPELAEQAPGRTVRVLANDRTPGLAGARNTGITAAGGDVIAFCDDDDTWVPEKLALQVPVLMADRVVLAVGGIRIRYGDTTRERIPSGGTIEGSDLASSRVTGSHPSTFLIRRDALLGELGLVDEEIPYGYGEDYDLLLRAARIGRIAVVPAVLAVVLWHPGSYFSRRWAAMIDGLGYLVEKHPEIATDRRGRAWVEGQRAFAMAADGRRLAAARTALASLRLNPREPRGPLALLVAARVLSAERVLSTLNARGRGI